MPEDERQGRKERRRQKLAKIRKPFLEKFYDQELSDIVPGDFDFNLQLLYAEGVRPIGLDTVVQDFGWEETDEVMTGYLNLHRPDPRRPKTLPIGSGMRVRCNVRWGRRQDWLQLWTMRVEPPDTDVILGDLSVTLADDLIGLKRNTREWSFRKTKQRDFWTVDQIARRVARRDGFQLGYVIKGQAQIEKLELEGTALDVLRRAVEKEKEHTGARYVIRARNGLVDIIPYRRNPILYVLDRKITGANVTEEQKERPVTSIVAKGRIGKGNKQRKLETEVTVPAVVRRWGYVAKEKNFGQVKSMARLRDRAKRELAEEIRIRRTVELEFPGIPFIRRGDGCRWINHEPGWHGPSETVRDRTFIYTDRISHAVGPAGSYRTSGTFVQEDPYVKDAVSEFLKQRKQREREREAA